MTDSTTLAQSLGARLSDQAVVNCVRIGAGKNSRVFALQLEDGSKRVIKFYFHHPSDTRDRLGAEFNALRFLERHQIECVARPLARDEENKAALYTYLEGRSVPVEEVSIDDIDAALSFAETLWRLSKEKDAHLIDAASEATFSFTDLYDLLLMRLKKLEEIQEVMPDVETQFRDHLSSVKSFFNVVRSSVDRNLNKRGSEELPLSERTLSPSDFGFHNALLGENGWYFIDFEYFGWDDPEKLISDFILHPGMRLSPVLQRHFVSRSLEVFGSSQQLRDRLYFLVPLFGIKWCAIILNEFVPEYRARRGFAARSSEDLRLVLETQLTKAERLIDSVKKRFSDGKII